MPAPAPSLRELARSLGLSHTTVSQALRGSLRVKKDTQKRVLKAAILTTITDALERKANWQQAVIACKDGTVLVVSFSHGCWGYIMAGPPRAHFSSTSGDGTFESVIADATKHADDSYGGVLWMQQG